MFAICQTHAVATDAELQEAVAEAVWSYNNDVNEPGVSLQQLVAGKNTRAAGDVLSGFHEHLWEHDLIEASPTMARQIAIRVVTASRALGFLAREATAWPRY